MNALGQLVLRFPTNHFGVFGTIRRPQAAVRAQPAGVSVRVPSGYKGITDWHNVLFDDTTGGGCERVNKRL